MKTLDRIREILRKRNWTVYRLGEESGIQSSTLTNMFNRDTNPTIPTLEKICKGLGITLSQFFAEGNMIELSDEQMELFEKWVILTSDEKQIIMDIINKFK